MLKSSLLWAAWSSLDCLLLATASHRGEHLTPITLEYTRKFKKSSQISGKRIQRYACIAIFNT